MLLFYLSLIESEEDKSKFKQLYKKYRAPMVHYATKMMGSETYSEDIVHETFMRIANHIDGVEDIDSHKTNNFIFTILKNMCIDFQRKGGKDPHISYKEEYDLYYRPYKKIQYNLEEFELSTLKEKIKELPDIYYDVINLKLYQGYNDKEIAQMLGIQTATVRKRMGRARQMLEFYLAEWFE